MSSVGFWSYICYHCKTVLNSNEYQWRVYCGTCKKKVHQFDLFGKDLKYSPLCLPETSDVSKSKEIKSGGKIHLKPARKVY